MSVAKTDRTDQTLRRMVADAHAGRAEHVVGAHVRQVLAAQLRRGISIAYEQDGWVVEEHPDGSIERLKRIAS